MCMAWNKWYDNDGGIHWTFLQRRCWLSVCLRMDALSCSLSQETTNASLVTKQKGDCKSIKKRWWLMSVIYNYGDNRTQKKRIHFKTSYLKEHINGGMQILRDTSFWSYRYHLSSGPQSVTMVRNLWAIWRGLWYTHKLPGCYWWYTTLTC